MIPQITLHCVSRFSEGFAIDNSRQLSLSIENRVYFRKQQLRNIEHPVSFSSIVLIDHYGQEKESVKKWAGFVCANVCVCACVCKKKKDRDKDKGNNRG